MYKMNIYRVQIIWYMYRVYIFVYLYQFHKSWELCDSLVIAASSTSGSVSLVSCCCVRILGVFRLLLHPSVDPHPSVLRLLRHPLVDPWCLPFAASSVSGSSFFVCFVFCVTHQWILRAFRLLLHPSVDP